MTVSSTPPGTSWLGAGAGGAPRAPGGRLGLLGRLQAGRRSHLRAVRACPAGRSSPRRRSRCRSTAGTRAPRWRARSCVVGANGEAGRASVLFCYALGKAQRILGELARLTDRPVFVHGALEPLTECYRQAGAGCSPPGRLRGGARPVVRRRADHRAASAGAPLDAPLRGGEHRLRLRLDAGARHPPPARLRPRLRDLGPRRLARLLRTIAETGAAGADHPRRLRVARPLLREGGSPPSRWRPRSPARWRARPRERRPGRPAGDGRPLKRFAALYEALDRTTSTLEKVAALAAYFAAAPPADAAWAVWFLTGRAQACPLGRGLAGWAMAEAGIPDGWRRGFGRGRLGRDDRPAARQPWPGEPAPESLR